MKKFLAISSLFLLLSFQTFAALPPLYQNIREIEAILSSKEFQSLATSAAVIEKIEKQENGYLVVTNKNVIFVEVEYIPTGRMGPAEFRLNVYQH